jgi:hypothetical protein
MTRKIIARAILLAFTPFAIQAQDEACCLNMSYTFVDAFYAHSEIDQDKADCEDCLFNRFPWPWSDTGGNEDADGDGYQLGASLGVFDHGFLFANYTDIDFEDSVDGMRSHFGAGANFQLWTLPIDLVLKAGYVDAELDTSDGDIEDDGFSGGIGLRAGVGDHVELEGGFTYFDLDAPFEDTVFDAKARVYITDDFALQAGLEVDENWDSPLYLAGLRYEFGRFRLFSDRSDW